MPTEDFKETVKQQADIVRIIGDYIKLKKAGAQNYSGLCPFHGEKTPSFSVHATRQFYHCFGCGVSGDVFSFVQKIENITFPEAVRLVAQKLGIPLPKITYSSPEEAKAGRLRAQLFDIQERAAAFFQECLKRPEGARAREYLAGRGLDEKTIAQFRIGFAPDSGFLLRDRVSNEFSEEVLRESGLFSWKEGSSQQEQIPTTNGRFEPALSGAKGPTTAMYSKFRNRVMFPIANDAGKIIAFTGRTLVTDEKSGPKYLNSPETGIYSKSRVLFNLDHAKEAIRKLDYAILVEGQMDCISVYAAGFHNVIASSGTAFTEIQAKLLGRFSKNAVVNFDPDTAGAKATERTLGLLVEEEFNIKVLTLEQGFDPDLYIRRKGKEAYGEALRSSQKYFDYLIDRARSGFPVRTPEGKKNAVNYLLPHIQRVPNGIVRAELANEIAQKLGIDSTVLRQELRHVAATRSAAAVKTAENPRVTWVERRLLRALCSLNEVRGEWHERKSDRGGANEEFNPARQVRYVLSHERLHAGLFTEDLLDVFLNADQEITDTLELPISGEQRNALASVLMIDESEDLSAEGIENAMRTLRRRSIQRRLDTVNLELRRPDAGRDRTRLRELTQEAERLKRALKDPSLAEDDPGNSLGNQKSA
jgi:DNA primase